MSLLEKRDKNLKDKLPEGGNIDLSHLQRDLRSQVGELESDLPATSVNDARKQSFFKHQMSGQLKAIRQKRAFGMTLTPEEHWIWSNRRMFPGGGD